MTPEEFVRFVHGRRFTLTDEKILQKEIAEALAAEGIVFRREVELSKEDVIDFLFPGGLGVEAKIKGGKRAIYRQCVRYCRHDAVRQLVLVSNVAMGFPPEIEGKPCWFANLGRGWL